MGSVLDVKGNRGKAGENSQNLSNGDGTAPDAEPALSPDFFSRSGSNAFQEATPGNPYIMRGAANIPAAAKDNPTGPHGEPLSPAHGIPETDTRRNGLSDVGTDESLNGQQALAIPDASTGRLPKPPRSLFGRSIFLRLVLPLSMIFLFSMGGAAFLNFTKFEQTYVTLAHERYDDVVRDLRFSIEESLGIGLSLGATQSTQVVIDRTVEQYDGAFELIILGPDGSILFSTQNATFGDIRDTEEGRAFIDQLMEETAAEARLGKSVTDEQFLSTTVIENPLGGTEGYLVLGHNRSEVQDVITRLGDVLWRGVAILSFVFVIIIAITVFLAIRPMERRFARGSQALAHLIETGDLAPVEPMGRQDDLAIGFSQARSIERELAAAEAQVMTVQER